MEQGRRAVLNGWQRLWVAIALISALPAVALVRMQWESGEVWLRELQLQPPTRVTVEGAGEVDFPATMSAEAIDLVTKGSGGNPAAIRAGIAAWTKEFTLVIDDYVARVNRSLMVRAAALWALGIAVLYGIGWLVAWVRRGFAS